MENSQKENHCMVCLKKDECVSYNDEDACYNCENYKMFDPIFHTIPDELDFDHYEGHPVFENPNNLVLIPTSPTSRLDKVVPAKDLNSETVGDYKKRVCNKCPVFIAHKCTVINKTIKDNYDRLAKEFFDFKHCFEQLDKIHFRDLKGYDDYGNM